MNRRRFAARALGALAWSVCDGRKLSAADDTANSGGEIPWTPLVEFDNHYFASLLLAMENLQAKDGANVDDTVFGDPNGLAGIQLTVPHARTRVKVTSHSCEFWDGGSFECALPHMGEKNWVAPRVRYHYDALRALTEPKTFDVTLAVEVDGLAMGEKTVSATMHPVRECVFATSVSAGYIDKTGVPVYSGFGWLFAAYIDEEHPFVETLIKEALSAGIVRKFDGYESGDPEQTLLQVFAIWEALSRRGVRYRTFLRTTAVSNQVWSEPVRSMDEIAANPSGTCAEAVVLMASALLKIGLRPYTVIVDERVELGVDRSDGQRNFVGIDPIYMGRQDVPASRWPAELRVSLHDTFKDSASLAAFGAALADGTDDVLSNKQKFTDIDPHSQMVDIRQSRRDGVKPFPRAT